MDCVRNILERKTVRESIDVQGISKEELHSDIAKTLEGCISGLKKVLLLPPDFTRSNSGAGLITAIYYDILKDSCKVDIMPALGTHFPMTEEEIRKFFGNDIPLDCFFVHDWKKDVVKIGEVPAEFVNEISEGLMNESIDVEVNKRLLDPEYDLVISIGQVVPHEVAGMANYGKNVFVGCGGSRMINASHMLGAFYGMERIMGKDDTPVRKVFDYAQEHFLSKLPLLYVLTVTTSAGHETFIHGLYAGSTREMFESAVAMSQKLNLTYVDKPLKKVVVFLDEGEFKSTWLGNKAIYRTRMAIEDGGELIVLAPGVRQFGEDNENDRLIRKYGYVGRKKVLELIKTQKDLQENLSVAAHLIHGSSDGRFSITYATKILSEKEVLGANFGYLDYDEIIKKYDPNKLRNGYNILDDGEEIFYISNPALGLWSVGLRLNI